MKDRAAEAARVREYRRVLKRTVLDHYGAVCVCCGEWRVHFLTIDHKNNDGAEQRRVLGPNHGRGWHFYAYLRRIGYPEGFQTLCANCNLGRHINGGECPHKDEGYATAS